MFADESPKPADFLECERDVASLIELLKMAEEKWPNPGSEEISESEMLSRDQALLEMWPEACRRIGFPKREFPADAFLLVIMALIVVGSSMGGLIIGPIHAFFVWMGWAQKKPKSGFWHWMNSPSSSSHGGSSGSWSSSSGSSWSSSSGSSDSFSGGGGDSGGGGSSGDY